MRKEVMNQSTWIPLRMVGEWTAEFIINYISFWKIPALLICNVVNIEKGYRPESLINEASISKKVRKKSNK